MKSKKTNKADNLQKLKCPECLFCRGKEHAGVEFSHKLYRQRVPVLNYSYSVKAGKPMMYYKNLSPIIIN